MPIRSAGNLLTVKATVAIIAIVRVVSATVAVFADVSRTAVDVIMILIACRIYAIAVRTGLGIAVLVFAG